MSKKKNAEFKAAIGHAQTDREPEVLAAANQANALVRGMNSGSLDAGRAAELNAVQQELTNTVQGFQSHYAGVRTKVTTKAKSLKQFNVIRKIAEIVLLLVAFIVLFSKWQVALLLVVVVLVARPILKKVLTGQAQSLAREAGAPVFQALTVIGQPEGGLHEASGLCARADALYLSTLDQTALMLEQQRRQSARQMAQMQAQHEAQMAQQQAALEQQKALMEAALEESQATNDALYGKPGFIGSAIRGHDKAKRQGK